MRRFTPFVLNLNKYGNFGRENILVVKANNELSWGTIPLGKTITTETNKKKLNIPSFDFFNYSNIQRPVKIMVLPKEPVVDIDLISEVENNLAKINYEIKTNKNNKLLINIYDKNKNLLVTQSSGNVGQILLPNPILWEPGKGYMYTFKVSIIGDDGNLIDSYYLPFGIRTVKVINNQFLINGKPFYFKGFGKHEDGILNGHGYNPVIIKRDFELIKWVGANSFRTSHYPYSEEIMQMADQEGIVVIDEVAAVGMFDVSSILNPTGESRKDFFKNENSHKITKPAHKQAVTELINRDKNHPCVVMWSLFNEPDTSTPEAVPYFEEIFALARRIDKQNLPKTFVMVQMSAPNKCCCQHLVDVICLNRYYGWYFQFGSQIHDGMKQLDTEITRWESKQNKPIVFTEFGCDTYAGLHKLPSVMWSEEYYMEYMNYYFKIFDNYKNVIGEQLWNFADFQTVEGIARVNGNKKVSLQKKDNQKW